MRPNSKVILSIASGVLCMVVILAGVFVFWQQDRSYYLRTLTQNQHENLSYETIDTHQFGPLIDKYKSPYMGDAVNINGLFHSLLLVRAGLGIGMDSDTYTVQVHYQTTEEILKPANVRVALVYNSVAAFTLIDNLQNIEYFFPENDFIYTINRHAVEAWFGIDDLAKYFPDEVAWGVNFQELIKDAAYRDEFFNQTFVTKDLQNSDADVTKVGAAAGLDPNGNGKTAG